MSTTNQILFNSSPLLSFCNCEQLFKLRKTHAEREGQMKKVELIQRLRQHAQTSTTEQRFQPMRGLV